MGRIKIERTIKRLKNFIYIVNYINMAPKKVVQKISGHEIEITRKPLINKKTKIEVVTILAKETAENVRQGKNKAIPLDYDDVKTYVMANKAGLFGGKNGKIKINVFTNSGWRSGKEAFAQGALNWFSLKADTYNEDEEVDEIYAFQILYLGW